MRNEQEFRFDQFRLLRASRLLLENDKPVRLGGRALDLLTALLERAGDIVSKEELIAYAWPDTIVEETSLRFHISSLRKTLGDGRQGARFIANISGRGYCFVGGVERVQHGAGAHAPDPAPLAIRHNLPVRLTRIVGRDDLVDAIARLLPERRFTSIVGPGGMGKSTLALAVCDEVLASYPDGAWFVDLAPVSDARLVPAALAGVLGVGVDEVEPMRHLSAYLRDRRMLILVDNCERLLDAAAVLVDGLLASSRHIDVLTTSREPLGAKGEWIQSLPPLSLPDASAELTAAQAMAFPAVQLFMERAVASIDGFELSDWEAPGVVEICRRLDGMPFAIELAAAHVDVFGVSGLLTQLDDRFPVLPKSRRAVPERHQTLRTLLDWSHDLLTEPERELLRRLAVFTASFTAEAAQAVGTGDGESLADVSDRIVALASKSLVVVVPGADEVRYRLLDTTRAYALERLEQDATADEVRRRHARYVRQVLAQAESDWLTMSRPDWLAVYAMYIDDIRAALDWAIRSPDGLATNIALATGASALAHHLSMQSEFMRRIEGAMARYQAGSLRDPLLELHLCTSLGGMLIVLRGPSPAVEALFARALDMATELGSDRHREIAINGMCAIAFNKADYPAALAHAEALARLASQVGDAAAAQASDRLKAQILLKQGQLRESKRLAERVLRHPANVARLASPYPMDRRVTMRMVLAQILWIEGTPEQALRIAIEAIELAESEPAHGQCMTLAWSACPIALWMGDVALARGFIARQDLIATQYSFVFQKAWAAEYGRALAFLERGTGDLGDVDDDRDDPPVDATLAPVSDVMGTMGEPFLTDEAIARVASGQAGWCAAEILRAQGDRALRREHGADEALARSFYEQALDVARRQGALAWELRATTSLAELERRRGRPQAGLDALAAVVGQFTEGFGTRDLQRANALLGDLAREVSALTPPAAAAAPAPPPPAARARPAALLPRR